MLANEVSRRAFVHFIRLGADDPNASVFCVPGVTEEHLRMPTGRQAVSAEPCPTRARSPCSSRTSKVRPLWERDPSDGGGERPTWLCSGNDRGPGGAIVKLTGDGVFASFVSASAATTAAA